MTSRAQAKIFRPLQLLDRFAVELEFISTGQPRFVFALGEDLEQVLRLETWGNELVVVQDTVFEPVLTIDEEQHDLRLRLVFDSQTNQLRVYDITGQLLVEIDQVSIIAEGLGIYIHNRGSDLTLQRLSVYHQTSEVSQGPIDPTRSRHFFVFSLIPTIRHFSGSKHNINSTRPTNTSLPISSQRKSIPLVLTASIT